MYPTAAFGFALIATCVLYALRPQQKLARLALMLGILTLAAGLLGAASGIATSAHFLSQVPKADQALTTQGLTSGRFPPTPSHSFWDGLALTNGRLAKQPRFAQDRASLFRAHAWGMLPHSSAI